MFSIRDKKIYLTKQDTGRVTVDLRTNDGNIYKMQDGDILVMTVKKSADEDSDICFEIETSDNTISIESSHTMNMKPGEYSFDIQMITTAGERYTVIGAESTKTYLDNFILLPEVTKR